MTRRTTVTLLLAIASSMPAIAFGNYTITQSATPTTYSTTLNFDEPGGPTGIGLPDNAFDSYGISALVAGDGNNVVADNTVAGPWIGTGNSFFGNFGVFITFAGDLTEFSTNVWDPSGKPSPFGGGLGVFVFDDGVEVTSFFTEPAWGGLGDPAIDIAASGGMVFDEVRILGFGFGPTTYVDDLSWNLVPEPGCGLLTIAFGILIGLRRRQR